MPDSSGSVDLGSLSETEREQLDELAAEQEEAPQEETEPTKPEATQVITAFLVLVGPDGNPVVREYSDPTLDVKFRPTPDLVYGAAATLQKDISGGEIAGAAGQATVQMIEAKTREAMEAQQAAHLQSKLGNLRG